MRVEEKAPFGDGYRPSHNFGNAGNKCFYMGQIEVPDGDWIHPGQTRDLSITLQNFDGLLDNLAVGDTWRIQEGALLVAFAEVLAVH
jgi:hypothetical protein